MENAINVSLSPLQVILSLAFQLWLVVFPIILIRKLNHVIALLRDKYDSNSESS